jgi:hypothetical protein
VVRLALYALCSVASLGAGKSTTYRNTAPGVKYIGSRACVGCHSKLYQDYIGTAMGRSMSLASSATQLEKVPASASVLSEKLKSF